MNTPTRRHLVHEGEAAPSFSLPAVSCEGTISLDDYRGSKAVLLGMLRGVYCGFCRRHVVKLVRVADQLRPMGVETVLVITTAPERARTYFKYYPTGVPVASDPEMSAHQAYGVTWLELTDEPTNWPATVNPEDIEVVYADHSWPEVSGAMSLVDAAQMLDERDGYQKDEADLRELDVTWHQLSGLVLVDRGGIVRWTDIEAPGGLIEWGNIASDTEIVAAARRVAA